MLNALVPHKHILFADLETYFDADYTLKKLNTSSYVRDKRFKAHMLGVQLDDGVPDVIEGKDIPRYLKKIKWDRTATCFHNSPFDSLILQHHYGVVPAYFYDTLAMARILHGADMRSDLDSTARHYGVGNKLEDVLMQSKGVLDLRSVPGLYDKMAVYCGVDVNIMYKIFVMMMEGAKPSGLGGRPFPQDELDLIHITTRMFADPVLRMDTKLLRQARDEEVERKRKLFFKALSPAQIAEGKEEMLKDKKAIKDGKDPDNIFDLAKWLLGKDRYFVPMLEALGIDAPQKFSDKQQKMIYATSKGDLEPLIDDLELQLEGAKQENDAEAIDAIDDAISVIEAKMATSSNIDITRAERFLALVDNGCAAPMGYNYGAAHTFRWGGSNKTNAQNLRRGSKLRLAIKAPTNHVCLVRDSSQIEARVIAKLAQCDWRLEAFRNEVDLYLRAASSIYHLPFESMSKETHEYERQIGKVAELALGFSGASGAFNSMAKNYGVVLPEAEVRGIVRNWRKDNPEIVQLWDDMSWLMLMMFCRKKGEFDVLRFEGGRDGGRILMPNGLYLKYPNLMGEINERKARLDNAYFTYKGAKKYIYGGALTENIVQCLARIIVGEQILAVERNKDFRRMQSHRLVMMTHDEGNFVVHKSVAKEMEALVAEKFNTPPVWWPDLPVSSDGGYALNYSK